MRVSYRAAIFMGFLFARTDCVRGQGDALPKTDAPIDRRALPPSRRGIRGARARAATAAGMIPKPGSIVGSPSTTMFRQPGKPENELSSVRSDGGGVPNGVDPARAVADMIGTTDRGEPMPDPDLAALRFLQTRRSRPAKTLGLPVPDRAALMPLLVAALRVPDHGKLEPWRLVVRERAALARLASLVPEAGARLGRSPEEIARQQAQFADAHLAVAVIAAPKPSDRIPAIEQSHSAGCVAYGLLNAALAAGWGANWLTGWASHERGFAEAALGLGPSESIVGFVHIGTERAAPPDRPRPDPEAVIAWMPE
jgi:nitroreductase